MILFIFLVVLFFFSPLAHAATGVSIASQGAPGTGLCSITRQFSQTDMAAWHTTALTLVSSPPTGLTIFPVTITASYNLTTTRYTWDPSPTIELRLGNITYKSLDNFITLFDATPTYPHVLQTLVATTNNGNIDPFVGAAASTKSTALRLVNVSATAIASGDGNVIISTQYYLLNSDGTISGQCLSSATGAPDGVTVSVGGNAGGPVSGETSAGDIDIAAHANPGSTGSLTNPWAGWEVVLATNRDGATCTTPAGYSVPTCLWPNKRKYYFRTGRYYQVYPVAFIDVSSPSTAPHNVFLEGAGKALSYIRYAPVDNSTSAFTLGRLGTHTFNAGIRNLTIQSEIGNTLTKVAIRTIDVSWVWIENNTISLFCDGFSRGLSIAGREFNWINHNQIIATLPMYLEGQPVVAEGGAAGGNAFNELGYSRFDSNELFGCDWDNPLIYVSPTTALNTIVFSGNSLLYGSNGFYWVADFTSLPDTRKAISHNVVIENWEWEQIVNDGTIIPGDAGKTGNGHFIHIDMTNNIGIYNLALRQNNYVSFFHLAPGYQVGGIRLFNAHNVEISGFHQLQQSVQICGVVLTLGTVHSVMVTGMRALPLPDTDHEPGDVVTACNNLGLSQISLGSGVCKTWQIPLSAAEGGKNTAIPATVHYDIPLDGGSCL